MSNEELLARALADELRPWLERIKALEVKTIEQAAELRLIKEMALENYREKRVQNASIPGDRTGLTFPGERARVVCLASKGAA